MNKKLFIILILGIVAFACSDIFEEDLSEGVVVLLAPADNLETSIMTHTFWWEDVEGTEKYNLQIVKPTFDYIEQLILDTNVVDNLYEFQLNPGLYQWRVKAYNSAYETEYSVNTLTIDSSFTLTGQKVSLLSPTKNDATNDTSVTFVWKPLPIADDYDLVVRSGPWEDNNEYFTKLIAETEFDTVLAEGEYSWSVQASDESSASISDHDPRSFFVDITSPDVPLLQAPADDSDHTSGVIDFSWQRDADSGSAIIDSILIAKDTAFTDLQYRAIAIDNEFTSNITVSGTQEYYWKVSATDAAGNWSGYSERRKFTITDAK